MSGDESSLCQEGFKKNVSKTGAVVISLAILSPSYTPHPFALCSRRKGQSNLLAFPSSECSNTESSSYSTSGPLTLFSAVDVYLGGKCCKGKSWNFWKLCFSFVPGKHYLYAPWLFLHIPWWFYVENCPEIYRWRVLQNFNNNDFHQKYVKTGRCLQQKDIYVREACFLFACWRELNKDANKCTCNT